MESKSFVVEAIEISEFPTLDRIEVFWRNYELGRGSVAITCYGCAWTAYFGAMGGRTIQRFFSDADTYYLVTKLGITPHLKQRKSDHAYLGRIVDAIKAAIAAQEKPNA